MTTKNSLSRRDFLKRSGVAASMAAAPLIMPGCVTGAQRPAPGSRITMGCIGVGNRGIDVMQSMMRDERVQVVAVCDVNKGSENGYWSDKPGGRDVAKTVAEAYYAEHTPSGRYSGVDTYADYRELLARGDLDTVLIALPDHWHALPVVEAANAGIDIYGEKPLSLTVAEGRIMSDAVKRNGRVFQVGSQQRSNFRFRKACELVRNGFIGDLHTVRCGLPGGTPDFSRHGKEVDPAPIPEGFDYEMWLGPAPEAPYIPACSHVNWRWVFNYSGGQVTDWGGHHPDIAQWGMNTENTGPVEIKAARAEYADHPVFNTAVKHHFECVYENGVTLIVGNDQPGGVTFEGTDGWVWADRGGLKSSPESLIDAEIPEDKGLYVSNNHQRNFIDCVYTGEDPVAPIETGHRSITIAHLGNIAMKLGQDLKWDPDNEQFTNSDEANDFLHRPYRGPWNLKGLPKGGKALA